MACRRGRRLHLSAQPHRIPRLWGLRKRHIWDRHGWRTCPMRRSWRAQDTRQWPARLGLSAWSDLVFESPSAPTSVHAQAYFTSRPDDLSLMQPTSASRNEDIASRRRRKWGEAWGGKSMLAICVRRSTELSVSHRLQSAPPSLMTDAAGRVAEWFKAPVLKTGVPARVPWVRIPPLPPDFC